VASDLASVSGERGGSALDMTAARALIALVGISLAAMPASSPLDGQVRDSSPADSSTPWSRAQRRSVMCSISEALPSNAPRMIGYAPLIVVSGVDHGRHGIPTKRYCKLVSDSATKTRVLRMPVRRLELIRGREAQKIFGEAAVDGAILIDVIVDSIDRH